MNLIRWFAGAIAIVSFLLLSCAPGPRGAAPVSRIIHCKVVVDRTFYEGYDGWRANIDKLMRRLSRDFENWFDVSFATDTVIVWDREARGCAIGESMECILDKVARDSQDVVIHFMRGGGYSPYETIGLTRPDWGYIAVKQMVNVNVALHFQVLYNTLFHEVCHLFGAVHVLARRDKQYQMAPSIADEYVTKVGKELTMVEPEIDKANELIVRGMIQRPLHRSADWPDSVWPSIRRLYRTALKEFNPGDYNERGVYSNFDEDLLARGDVYLMMSTWASMCGKDTVALAYIDSTERFWDSFTEACHGYGLLGSRSQEICGIIRSIDPALLRRYRMNSECYSRAIIQLRAGRLAEAEENIRLMRKNGVELTGINWAGYEDLYEWERRMRCGVLGSDSTGQGRN